MLNPDMLLREGIEQVKAAGIKPGSIDPEVIINTRAVRIFGRCSKIIGNKYDFKIEINHRLLEVEKEIAMNTMVHEILHTVKGCMNHGQLWQNNASIMNDKFGYDISRTTSYEKVGLERPKAKYVVVCDSCPNIFYRQRKSKLITNIKAYECGCGGSLSLE